MPNYPKCSLEISTSMGRVRRATTTGSVMASTYGVTGKRARNSNQLDLFSSLFIDPAVTAAPTESQPDYAKVEDGRKEPLAGNDSQPLAGVPPADGRGAAPEQQAGGSDFRGGEAHSGPSLRTAVGEENGISGGMGAGDTGVGVPADRGPPVARVLFDLNPSPEEKPSRDFRITDSHRIGQGGLHEKARDNLAAIRTLKTLESEDRDATDSEKAVLVRYAGWGAMPNAFSYRPPEEWKGVAREVEQLLTPDEYA